MATQVSPLSEPVFGVGVAADCLFEDVDIEEEQQCNNLNMTWKPISTSTWTTRFSLAKHGDFTILYAQAI